MRSKNEWKGEIKIPSLAVKYNYLESGEEEAAITHTSPQSDKKEKATRRRGVLFFDFYVDELNMKQRKVRHITVSPDPVGDYLWLDSYIYQRMCQHAIDHARTHLREYYDKLEIDDATITFPTKAYQRYTLQTGIEILIADHEKCYKT
ncbi:hypothetical protein ES703_61529 [subsurface metagenome]